MYLLKTTMILVLAGPALAQLAKTNEPTATVSEGQLIQALMTEMRQLRQALERAVFVSSRIQIATQRLQSQESRVARLSGQLDEVRRSLVDLQTRQVKAAERVKDIESRLQQQSDPNVRREMETDIGMFKTEIESLKAQEQQRRTRESELATWLQSEQARWNEINDALNLLERSLDPAR